MISCARPMRIRSAEPVIHVSVIRAWPGRFDEVALSLPAGATAGEARRASGLDEGISGTAVFGVRVEEVTVLNEGDRLELLRALTLDPKDARRKRAEARAVKHKKW